MLTAPLSVDNKTEYSADGYCFKGWYWMCCWHSWGSLRLFLLSTDWQTLLKIHLLERAQVCQATKLHTWEKRCIARAHKLGNLPPETCSCWKANQKAWRNLTAGRLTSLPPPPLLLSSVVEGISMAGAYSPGSISILLYLSLFPALLLKVAMKKSVKAYAVQIVKMHINVCPSAFLNSAVGYSSCF